MKELFESLIYSDIEGLVVYQGKKFSDSRGDFRKFLDKSLIPLINEQPTECYISTSVKNSVRGLHFQKEPYGQYKIVACLTGSFIDVAVDLRPNSKTFGKTFSIEISERNNKIVFVPPLFAHGIISLVDNTTMLSLSSVGYYPEYEEGVRIDSVGLDINFSNFQLTLKDANLPKLSEYISRHDDLQS
jgi:dTDP-4-dehydrorhamnose 3,5-epimerase